MTHFWITSHLAHQKQKPFENEHIIKKYQDYMSLAHETVLDAMRYTAISIKTTEKITMKDYDISELTKIHIDLYKSSHRLTKKGYRAWVVGHCLTEMLEALDIYIRSILKDLNKHYPTENIKKVLNRKATVTERITFLTKLISEKYSDKFPLGDISIDELNAIDSIRLARNCIVHNKSITNEQMVKGKDFFELGWFYIKDYYILANGSKIEKNKTKKTKRNIVGIYSGFGYYCKKFQLNKEMKISEHDLFRIGFFIMEITWTIHPNLKLLFNCDGRQAVF